MPNILNANGLQLASLTEIVAAITAGLKVIYGDDINLGSNTPDGQMVNIYAQSAIDNGELIEDTYNSFSIAGSYGTTLDVRGNDLIGTARQPGTQTVIQVLVTVTQALTLYGADQSVQSVDTIADTSGNQYQLLSTTAFSGGGSLTLSYQCTTIGAINPAANTVQTIVTVTLGRTAVNNPSATPQQNVGLNEETDAQYRVRLAQSTSLGQDGPADAVQAQLLNLTDVTDALVVENDTGSPAFGINEHSIWAIVEGGTAAEIAQAIYAKKGSGCGMQGAQSYTITRSNGLGWTAQWDTPLYTPIFIRFSLQPRGVAASSFDATSIAQQLASALIYKLGQNASIGDVVAAMLTIAPNGIMVDPQISTNGSDWFTVLVPSNYQHKFTVNSGNIAISVL